MRSDRVSILVVDDSRADGLLIKALLEQTLKENLEFSQATEFKSAMDHLSSRCFDCLILDYLLDDRDGLELLRSVRADGNDVPVIAVSGNGSETVAANSLKFGAQDYLVKKNLTAHAIHRAVFNAIDKVSLSRQLAARNAELQRFAYVAAHDLRSPLCSIHGYAQLLLEGNLGKCDECAIRTVGKIERTAARMSTLIESLLEYAESGDSQVLETEVELDAVLRDVLGNLSTAIQSSRAAIEVDSLPRITGSHTALTQLFQNLIANAIKFAGDKAPRIIIESKQTVNETVVCVKDHGLGIAPDKLETIFLPFQKAHQSQIEGSGIGLATCARIIERHGGRIEVTSLLGEGTTFRLHFPLTEAREVETAVETATSDESLKRLTLMPE